MAKKPNNTNFDELFASNSPQTISESNLRAKAKAIGKEEKKTKKTHVSVLLNDADFEYVRDRCYKLRISKNEFYKMLLDDYRAQHPEF